MGGSGVRMGAFIPLTSPTNSFEVTANIVTAPRNSEYIKNIIHQCFQCSNFIDYQHALAYPHLRGARPLADEVNDLVIERQRNLR